MFLQHTFRQEMLGHQKAPDEEIPHTYHAQQCSVVPPNNCQEMGLSGAEYWIKLLCYYTTVQKWKTRFCYLTSLPVCKLLEGFEPINENFPLTCTCTHCNMGTLSPLPSDACPSETNISSQEYQGIMASLRITAFIVSLAQQ